MSLRDMSTENFGGALVNRRDESLWTWADAKGLEMWRHEFIQEIYDGVETESQWHLRLAGKSKVLTNGNIHNDFYGLGTSVRAAIEEATEVLADYDSSQATIEVVTSLKTIPLIPILGVEPLYNHTVKVMHAPSSWWLTSSGDKQKSLFSRDEEFIVWRDGEETRTLEILVKRIKELVENDLGGRMRKGGPDVLLGSKARRLYE